MVLTNDGKEILTVVFIFAVFSIGTILGCVVGRYAIQRDAVKHGAAQYNQTTAQFEWKENQ
jgi:hypothetical protein